MPALAPRGDIHIGEDKVGAIRLRTSAREGLSYRSVKATSKELKTGLNIYRMIDFEPV
jgi:hypothetical protein